MRLVPEKDFAGRQYLGHREAQEDTYGFCPLSEDLDGIDGMLLLMADGMGGYRGGAMAGRIVLDGFVEAFFRFSGAPSTRLRPSLLEAQRHLVEWIDSEPDSSLHAMGCTFVGAIWTPVELHWISVGDSPLFLLRQGELQQLNEDHSVAGELRRQVDEGNLSQEEAEGHPAAARLMSAVIYEGIDRIDERISPYPLEAGDLVLVATDGLVNALSLDEIAAQLREDLHRPAHFAAERLIDLVEARNLSQQDNTTVAILKSEPAALP